MPEALFAGFAAPCLRLLDRLSRWENRRVRLLQFTDLHIRPPGRLAYGRVDSNAAALRACTVAAGIDTRLDAIIITGDLTDCGLAAEYEVLRRCLEILAPLPVFLLPGNHDRRETLLQIIPETLHDGGFVQYVVEDHPVRLVILDTVVAGQTHGHLCAARLAWLRKTLAAAPARETLIAMHHPPMLTGSRAFDHITLDNRTAFHDIIAANPQVTRIICGHHHRMIFGSVAQAICIVAPSIAYQFVLCHDDTPETGFVLEPPMFLLHDWSAATGFITHSLYVDQFDGPFPVALEPEYPG